MRNIHVILIIEQFYVLNKYDASIEILTHREMHNAGI